MVRETETWKMTKHVIAIVAAVTMLASIGSADRLFDDFSVGNINGGITIAGTGTVQTEQENGLDLVQEDGLVHVYGGTRITRAEIIDGPTTRKTQVYIPDDRLWYNNESYVVSRLTLTYLPRASEPGEQDFSGQDTFGVGVNVTSIDLTVNITLGLVDASNNSHTVTQLLGAAGETEFDFSAFSSVVDLEHIVEISVAFEGPAALDMIIERLATTGPDAGIGDRVWHDIDQDGIQDDGEPGISDVEVNLYDGNGAYQDTTTTDATGFYEFRGLYPGDYFVEFVPPTGWVVSPQDAGTDDTADSDANAADGRTIVTTLDNDEYDPTWDCGLYLPEPEPASIGDLVWHDLNKDGIQDDGEPGIDDVTVTLYDAAGAVVGTTTTAGGGLYLFEDLEPGDYHVEFTLPTGWTVSPQDAGTDDAVDSDGNTTTGVCIVTTLDPGEDDMTWDLGLYRKTAPEPASIGDLVWHDLNEDGIQDAGEPGIDGVTVTLFDAQNNPIASMQTAGGGLYKFELLDPGDYHVEFTLPAGWTVSPRDQGTDDAVDSDGNTTTGVCVVTTLVAGENDMTWDLGLFKPEPPEEDITVVKTGKKICSPAPPQDCGKCDGKVTRLRLRYRAGHTAQIRVEQKDGQVVFNGSVDPNGEFSFVGTDKKGTLGTEIAVYVDGQLNTKIHTSCSRPIGPGLVSGDFLVVYGESRNGGPLPAIGAEPGECEGEEGDCDPTLITIGDTIEYTIIVAANLIEARTVEILDDLDSALTVVSISHGGQYVAEGGYVRWLLDLPAGQSETVLTLTVKVSAAPTGDNVGAEEEGWTYGEWVELPVEVCTVVPCGDDDDDDCKKHQHRNRNRARCGDDDDDDGDCKKHQHRNREHSGHGKDDECCGETTTCEDKGCKERERERERNRGNQHRNRERNRNRNRCGDDDDDDDDECEECEDVLLRNRIRYREPEPPEEDITVVKTGKKICPPSTPAECGKCDGKVTRLRLRYRAGHTAQIRVEQKDGQVVFNGPVGPNGEFSFEGNDKKGTLGTEIAIYVDGHLNTAIHTSCSRPIGPGLVSADFLVIYGESRNGGPLPAIGAEPGECEGEEGDCDPTLITIGDTIEYTIIVAANLIEARTVEILDDLDSALTVVSISHGGQYVAEGGYVRWLLDLPAGQSETVLTLTVKVSAAPTGDNVGAEEEGWTYGEWVELLVEGDDGQDVPLKNRIRYREPEPPAGDDDDDDDDDDGCTYTIGYWKNHAEDWPVDELTIAGITYTKAEAIALLNTPPKKGDATIILVHQLIGAMLNVANGADDSDVADTIAAADEWLVVHPVGTNPKGPSREIGIELAAILDAYNNGNIGPGHCDGEGSF